MHLFRALLPTLFLVLATSTSAAVTAETATPTIDEFVVRLGTPVRPEAAESLLDALSPSDTEAGVRLSRALGTCGGHAAAKALSELLGHEDARVREMALRAAGQVALRTETLADNIRRSLHAPRAEERSAAVRALGSVGDGRDVPHLLYLIGVPEVGEGERAAAYAALAQLGGVSIPAVPARWRAWWKGLATQGRADLVACLDAMEQLGVEDDPLPFREVLMRRGWLDVSIVCARLKGWLVEPDPVLRREGCLLASELRLAELREDVAWVAGLNAPGGYREVARQALRTLGALHDETPADHGETPAEPTEAAPEESPEGP